MVKLCKNDKLGGVYLYCSTIPVVFGIDYHLYLVPVTDYHLCLVPLWSLLQIIISIWSLCGAVFRIRIRTDPHKEMPQGRMRIRIWIQEVKKPRKCTFSLGENRTVRRKVRFL